jgi:hypothetical protein
MERHDHAVFVPDALKLVQRSADLRCVAVDSRLLEYWEAQRALRGEAIEDRPSGRRHGEQPATAAGSLPRARSAVGATREAEALVALTIDDR